MIAYASRVRYLGYCGVALSCTGQDSEEDIGRSELPMSRIAAEDSTVNMCFFHFGPRLHKCCEMSSQELIGPQGDASFILLPV